MYIRILQIIPMSLQWLIVTYSIFVIKLNLKVTIPMFQKQLVEYLKQ